MVEYLYIVGVVLAWFAFDEVEQRGPKTIDEWFFVFGWPVTVPLAVIFAVVMAAIARLWP